MFELPVLERHKNGATKGLGKWVFAFPPRVGDIIHIPGASPSMDFYAVVAVEHVPLAPESQRSAFSSQTPTATLIVEWSHDED